MITLRHGDRVKLADWADNVSADVGTVAGYAAEVGSDVANAVALATTNSHDMAWTMYSGGSLISDRPAAARKLDDDRARHASAMLLQHRDRVEIEGATYRVLVNVGNAGRFPLNSDPIRFWPCG